MGVIDRIFPKAAEDPEHTAIPAWTFTAGEKVRPVAFIWDTQVIVTIAEKTKLALFSKDGVLLWSYPAGKAIHSIAISSDGQFIAAVSYNCVYYFHSDGTLLWRAPIESSIAAPVMTGNDITISSDGHYIVAFVIGGPLGHPMVYFFNDTGQLLWTRKTGVHHHIAVSSDGQFVALAPEEHSVYFLNRDGNLLWEYEAEHSVRSVAMPADGRFVVAGTGESGLLYLGRDGHLIRKIPFSTVGFTDTIVLSSGGQHIAFTGNIESNVCVITSEGELLDKYPVGRWWGGITCITISPDGRYIAAGSGKKLHCYSIDHQLSWSFVAYRNISSIAISANNQYLAAISEDNKLYFFYLEYFHDTPPTLRQKALDALGDLQTRCTQLEKEGVGHGIPLEKIRDLIEKNNCIEAIRESKRWLSGIDSVKEFSIRASHIVKEIPSPLFSSLYHDGKYRDIIERYNTLIEQRKKIHELLKTAEKTGTIPDSLQVALKSDDPEVLETAINDLGGFILEARPDLQITFAQTGFSVGTWSKTRIEITNNGDARALDVILTFPDEIEVRGMHPFTIQGRTTLVENVGIKPKMRGSVPIEIIASYSDTNKKEYRQALQFWIEVADKGAAMIESAATPTAREIPLAAEKNVPDLAGTSQLPPELLYRYSDATLIGKGGFARVFKAKRKDGQYVAVKVPISFDASTGKTFIAELKNWTKLDHANIVKVYEFNILPVAFFEMELCNGSLADVKKPINSAEAAWILFNICEGLKYTHARKIIHRDLKPLNILFKDGVPKISDWGLSRVITESTSTSLVSFSPHYAAPEQIGNKAKDERTDIWQLGVILYELVTGELPFMGENMIEIGMGIATNDPKLPGEIIPGAKRIEPVITKCLEKDPAQRYQSVTELQKALAGFLRMNYAESLNLSINDKDFRRSASYCSDLVIVSLQSGDIGSASGYLSSLERFAEGDVKEEAHELAEQIRIRIDHGLDEIPDELIRKAEFIAHKVRLGFIRTGN